MSFLSRVADRAAQGVDSWANGIVNAIPRTDAGEREIRARHDEWMRTAQLGRRYWTPQSEYIWLIGPNGDERNAVLRATYEYTFVRRDRVGLYTAAGDYSWPLFFQAGFEGFTTVEPSRPPKLERFFVQGSLEDSPEKWIVTR